MNEKIKQLAEEAGFILWRDEHWNPGDVVDWASRYDDELQKFAELIVQKCAHIARSVDDANAATTVIGFEHFGIGYQIADDILKEFDENE